MQLLHLFLLASLAAVACAAPVAPPAETCSNSLLGSTTCSCLDSCSEDQNCCADYDIFLANVRSALATTKSKVPFQRKPLRSGDFDPKVHKYELGLFQVTPNKQSGSALVAVHTCIFENYALTGGDRGHDDDTPFIPDPANPRWVWRDCTAEFDVVVVTKAGQLASFESQVKVPAKVHAAFGPRPRPSVQSSLNAPPLYYAELTGAAAVAAYKQALVRALLITSFSGQVPAVAQGKAAEFDPTEGRKWALTSATFKVDDEHKTAFAVPAPKPTVNDVSAGQLDQNYAKFAKQVRGRVVPSDTIMHKIWDGKQWQDVFEQSHPWLAKVVPSLLE